MQLELTMEELLFQIEYTIPALRLALNFHSLLAEQFLTLATNMFTYRITFLLGKLDTSVCPPPVVAVLFPSYSGEPVTLTDSEITVTFQTEQTPVDLGALVKVELLPNE